MSFEFDESYYLKSKLAQLQASDAATYGEWGTADVRSAILGAGFASVQDHFEQYSLAEGTSPNPYFNTMEYLEAKVNQLNSTNEGGRSNWTVAEVIKAFQDAGFTNAMDHYEQYGCKEVDNDGKLINPSNAFDANAYVAAKLAQLQATDPENWGSDKTAKDVLDAITDAGMTPIDHFEQYGEAEGDAAGIDMVQTVPVVERVANDELRDAMGENVPSNYNPATAAPENVTTGTSVAKPCDMGDSSTVKPEEPVATPADDAYVAVPGGGIKDTNENPVVLVSETIKDAAGKDVTVANYGVTQDATTDADGNKVQEVAAVDANGKVDTEATSVQKTTTAADGTSTVATSVADADGNKIEKTEAKDASGATTSANTAATFADGSTAAVAASVSTDGSTGYTTTTETRSDTTAAGATTTTEHSESVSPSGNETITTDKTTNPDGTSTEETKTVTKNDDGTTTTKDSVKETAADGTSTEKTTTETQNADGEQVGDKTEVTTERDADGAISKQETKTTDTSGESKTEDTTEQAQKDDPDTPDPDAGGGSGSSAAGKSLNITATDEDATGSSGDDTFTIAVDQYAGTIEALAGNDTFKVTEAGTMGAATLDGGEGDDTLLLAANVTVAADAPKLNSVETLKIGTGVTATLAAALFDSTATDEEKFSKLAAEDATAQVTLSDAFDAKVLDGAKMTVKAASGGLTLADGASADLSGVTFVSDFANPSANPATDAQPATSLKIALAGNNTFTITADQAAVMFADGASSEITAASVINIKDDFSAKVDINGTVAAGTEFNVLTSNGAHVTVPNLTNAVTVNGGAGNDKLGSFKVGATIQDNVETYVHTLVGGNGSDLLQGGLKMYAGDAETGADTLGGATTNFNAVGYPAGIDEAIGEANVFQVQGFNTTGKAVELFASDQRDVIFNSCGEGANDASNTTAFTAHNFTLGQDALLLMVSARTGSYNAVVDTTTMGSAFAASNIEIGTDASAATKAFYLEQNATGGTATLTITWAKLAEAMGRTDQEVTADKINGDKTVITFDDAGYEEFAGDAESSVAVALAGAKDATAAIAVVNELLGFTAA